MVKSNHIYASTEASTTVIIFQVAKVAILIRIMLEIDDYDDDQHLQKIAQTYIPASQRKTANYNYLLLLPMILILLGYRIFPKSLHYLVLIHSYFPANTQLIAISTHSTHRSYCSCLQCSLPKLNLKRNELRYSFHYLNSAIHFHLVFT